jgi:hypothetical protein
MTLQTNRPLSRNDPDSNHLGQMAQTSEYASPLRLIEGDLRHW